MGAHSRPGLWKRVFAKGGTPAPVSDARTATDDGWLESLSGEEAGPVGRAAPVGDAAPVGRAGPVAGAVVGVTVDPLTGLPVLEDLLRHIDRCSGRASSLVLVDMDDFASYNQRWGREAGDEAIKAIAATLAACADGRAEVFRAGGDRFAAVVELGEGHDGSASAWAGAALAALAPLNASAAVVVLRAGYRAEAIVRDAEMTLLALKEAGGAMVGTHGPHVDEWARSRRHEVEDLARQVEELRLENRRLTESMILDPVTGLPNETAFEADHNQLDHRRRRSEDPYSVILAEIDHFQEYRQEMGEEAATEAIKAVAATIDRTVRGSDRTYRLGEADFAVLLPGAQMREAVAAAERVRIRVEKLDLAHRANPRGTVTVTLAAVGAGFRHKSTKEVMVELQDVLASGAAAGRNRVLWPL